MFNIPSTLQCLLFCLDTTTHGRLIVIVSAMLAMTGRITMLGISRWTGDGGSYRTVQRFYNTPLDWLQVNWCLIQHLFLNPKDVWILVGDEVVVNKSGKKTFGLGKFFSSIIGKVVPGLSFFSFSLVNTRTGKSHPLMTEQITESETRKPKTETNKSKSPKKKKRKRKRKRGRPKGSKNKNREDVEISPYLTFVQGMLNIILPLISGTLAITYVVFDGAFGNNYALQMVKRCNLHLISKLQCNSALYFPYKGEQKKRGRKRKYGDKIKYDNIPEKYLKESSVEDGILTNIYQMQMLHKLFPQLLNIVIIVKINLETQARAHVVLFSSDLNLSYDKIIDYYKLRFQIEFNFRDAKQYWGLEDFMNVKERQLNNAVGLAFFMVLLSQALIRQTQEENPNFSVLDLKAHFRGMKYVDETLKRLPNPLNTALIQRIRSEIAKIGSINVA